MKQIMEVRDLVKTFPAFQLGPINLAIPEGAIVGFIGENGAGKSSTIKCLLGLLEPDRGEIKIFNQSLAGNPKQIRSQIGVVLDDLNLPDDLSLEQVGRFCAKLYPGWEADRFQNLIDHFLLPNTKKIKQLSRGMRMKLSIAIALSHGARFLILDEATSGLDPVAREEILDLLLEFIQDESHSVFISSHILSDLEKAADYIAFIHRGQLIFFEDKDSLRDNYALYAPESGRADGLAEGAIVGQRQHAFGRTYLVKRHLVPPGLILDRPSIEEIMLFFIKGGSYVGSDI